MSYRFESILLVLVVYLSIEVLSGITPVMLPMRDGVQLYSVVYTVSDAAGPTVYIRTPYGTNSEVEEALEWTVLGFHVVLQDFRGRYNSQGTFVYWSTDADDSYDTMAWIVKQTWSNQKVFTSGYSAVGIAQYLQPIVSPPWLKGQTVGVATSQVYNTMYQGGAFREALIVGWTVGLNESQALPPVESHEAFSSYWDSQDMTNKFKNVNFPAVHLTGWYDIFCQQQLDAYAGYQDNSAIPGYNWLIISPGGHCQASAIPWPDGSLAFAAEREVAARMFTQLNKSDNLTELRMALSDVPPVLFYVLGPGLPGSIGNFWASGNMYPPIQPKPLNFYLTLQGTLEEAVPPQAQTSYVYNPANPVHTIGGNNLILSPCGPNDQSSLYGRNDILSFISPPLTDHLLICGKLQAIDRKSVV